jgi:hypothetical protein
MILKTNVKIFFVIILRQRNTSDSQLLLNLDLFLHSISTFNV